MNIVHLTSAHPRYDTRIFLKECRSLAAHDYSVFLVVADGKGDERKYDVSIVDVGSSKGRFDRIRYAPSRVFEKAVELNGDIYHLHDPELIPIGIQLKKLGKKVIFDAHEDVPMQLLAKPYLNKPIRKVLSKGFSIYEKWACKKLDAVIAATPFIRDKYRAMGIKCVDVKNYPILEELAADPIDWSKKKRQVCYVGGLGRTRGIREIVQAAGLGAQGVGLAIGGQFTDSGFEREVKSELGWQRTTHLGWLGRDQVRNTLYDSIAGLVTLHPKINYFDALPIKMFEYMAAGLPVIASDFPLWRQIIEADNCGICVDPLSPEAISEAINYLAENPAVAERMGRNGQRAVEEKYNWSAEELALLKFYGSLE